METTTLFQASLVLHICGFATLTGALLADITIQSRLNKYLKDDLPKANAIVDSASGIPFLLIAGTLLAILAGVAMMALTHGAFGEMLWMRIKIVFVVLLLLNAIVIARPSGVKLKKLLQVEKVVDMNAIVMTRNRIKFFHISQSLLLLIIFILSAFKFN